MKRTTIVLMVAAIALAFWVQGYAEPFTATIKNSDGAISESGGYDTWLSARIPGTGQSLIAGNSFEFKFTFDPGFQLTDGIFNGPEAWILKIEPAQGVPGGGQATLEAYLTNNGQEILTGTPPAPTTRTTLTQPVAEDGSVNFRFEQSFWDGVQNVTDFDGKLTYVSGATWNIQGMRAGVYADNIYNLSGGGPTPGAIPEPATVISFLLGGAGLAAKRLMRREKA